MQSILRTVISCKWSWVYVQHPSCCQLESHWIKCCNFILFVKYVLFWNLWFVLLVNAFKSWIQRCNSKQKTFFPFCDLTFAKVPHAEISFQYLFFFQSQTCTQTQKPLCIASCFKYCDSTMCCPFSAWAKDLCSMSVHYQVPSLLYLLSTIPIHLTFH